MLQLWPTVSSIDTSSNWFVHSLIGRLLLVFLSLWNQHQLFGLESFVVDVVVVVSPFFHFNQVSRLWIVCGCLSFRGCFHFDTPTFRHLGGISKIWSKNCSKESQAWMDKPVINRPSSLCLRLSSILRICLVPSDEDRSTLSTLTRCSNMLNVGSEKS